MFSVEKLGQAAEVEMLTIRYYEQIGLLPKAEPSRGNQRLYGPKRFNSFNLSIAPTSGSHPRGRGVAHGAQGVVPGGKNHPR